MQNIASVRLAYKHYAAFFYRASGGACQQNAVLQMAKKGVHAVAGDGHLNGLPRPDKLDQQGAYVFHSGFQCNMVCHIEAPFSF